LKLEKEPWGIIIQRAIICVSVFGKFDCFGFGKNSRKVLALFAKVCLIHGLFEDVVFFPSSEENPIILYEERIVK
jgi:hypothetical protein